MKKFIFFLLGVPLLIAAIAGWVGIWITWAIKSDPTALRVAVVMGGMVGVPLGIFAAIVTRKKAA